jgi:hypothetical protein
MSEPRSRGEDKPRDLVFFEPNKRSGSTQPLPQLLSRQPRNADYLSSAGLAGRYGNGRTWNLQKICEEFDAGFIGVAFDRLSPVMAFFFARG